MHIADILWLPDILDKLAWKHHVSPEEVVEVLSTHALYRKVQTGPIPGEDLYAACGQTEAGRYLIVFFIYKPTQEALIISARDMDAKERRQYGRRETSPNIHQLCRHGDVLGHPQSCRLLGPDRTRNLRGRARGTAPLCGRRRPGGLGAGTAVGADTGD